METKIYLPPEPEFEEAVQTVIPHNREAEAAVIGSIFINPDVLPELALFLEPRHFYIHKLRWIYEACLGVTDIDLITIGEALERRGMLAEAGGPAYLTSLINAVPSSLNAESYARIVYDCWLRRQGIEAANETAAAAYRLSESFEPEVYALKLTELTVSNKPSERDILAELKRDLYETNSFTYGVGDLDVRLGGKFRKELEVYAGDQGTGKTAKMFSEALANLDAGRAGRVLVASLEMTEKGLWARKACGELCVSWNQVRAKRVSRETLDMVYGLVENYLDLYRGRMIVYEAPMGLSNIVAAAVKEKPDMVYVDHVFLIEGMQEAGSDGMQNINTLNAATRILKQRIAKPLDCHVTVLWQLGKSFAKEKRKPTKHDLFLAGTRDPDSILIFYRPDQYQPEGVTPAVVDVDVIVGKARNDYSGNGIVMKYNLERQTFHGLAREDRNE